jgi:hypothetical protein
VRPWGFNSLLPQTNLRNEPAAKNNLFFLFFLFFHRFTRDRRLAPRHGLLPDSLDSGAILSFAQ